MKNIGNTLAEGYLIRSDIKLGWSSVYSILTTDTLYIFKDDSRNNLLSIINLSRSSVDEYGDSSIALAQISKYVYIYVCVFVSLYTRTLTDSPPPPFYILHINITFAAGTSITTGTFWLLSLARAQVIT